MIKKFLVLLFLVRVVMPFGFKQTYDNVQHFTALTPGMYRLVLEDDSIMWVPIAFTIIKEK